MHKMRIEGVEMEPVISRSVSCLGYNNNLKILYVTFKNNTIYKYFNVPFEIYSNVQRGKYQAKNGNYPSIGAALDFYVKKKNNRYERIR